MEQAKIAITELTSKVKILVKVKLINCLKQKRPIESLLPLYKV